MNAFIYGHYGSFTIIHVQKQNGEIVWNRVDDMTAELYDNVNDNENLS